MALKLTGLQVDEFGIWRDLSIPSVPPDMVVFFGHNEAGKTTLMQFIRSVLYGFSSSGQTQGYLPVGDELANGAMAGGTLHWQGSNGPVFATRHWHSNSSARGELRVTQPDGNAIPDSEFFTLLQAVDESIYNNVFAFGLRDLQELGTLDDTQAAELLYKLSSGLDRISLVDVIHDLKHERDQLLTADNQSGKIAKLLERRDGLRDELHQLEEGGQLWIQLVQQHDRLREELQQREGQAADDQKHSRFIELAIQVHENWTSREHLGAQISRLKPPIELPQHALEQLDRLNREIVEKQAHLQQLRQDGDRLRKEYRELNVNQPLWSHAARIDALSEQIPWIESLQRTVGRLQEEIVGIEDKITIQIGSLDPTVTTDDDILTGTSSLSEVRLAELPRLIPGLRGPSRNVQQATQRLKTIKAEVVRATEDVDAQIERLGTELAQRDRADLTASLRAAGTRVSQLRRVIQLESKLKKMKQHHIDIQEERTDLLDEQFLPWYQLIWTGVLFIAGMILALVGIFYPRLMPFGVIGVALGSLVCIVAIVFKVALERRARQELGDCENQLELLREQLTKTTTEQQELLDVLPPTVSSLDNRLESAESELQTMEELVPLAANREAAQQRLEAALQRVQEASREVAEARTEWRGVLKQYQLPTHLTPRQIKQLATGHQQLGEFRKTLAARRELLQVRQDELLTLSSRIEHLLAESRLSPQSHQPKDQIHQLIRASSEQEQRMQRRRYVRQHFRQARRDFRRTTRALENLQHRRDALFATAGILDEASFRKQVAQQQTWRELRQQYDDLSGKIEATVGTPDELDRLAGFLQSHSGSLEHLWNDAQSQVQQSESRLASLHERRGAMQQEMKSLAEDSRLMEARLELNCLEVELTEFVCRWRVLATSVQILTTLCRKYESDHQPETLGVASEYLSRMTRQRYVRLWTPLDQNVLRVDQRDGRSLPLEALSRGTREAVFISLRLALVEAFSRRGVKLPLVLDDVLVNFDLPRAEATIEVLREFADSGHQLLVFTCHDHLVQAFRDAQVTVHSLPHRMRLLDAPETVPLTPNVQPEEESTAPQAPCDDTEQTTAPQLESAPDTLPVGIARNLPTGDSDPPPALSNLYDKEIAGPLQSNRSVSDLIEEPLARKKPA